MAPEEIVVVGGGAAGFFAAITCAEAAGPRARVTLCEATRHPLAKVRVSGGGRCNVTHACFDPAALVRAYPRGSRELRGAFHRWQPRDTVEWFEGRGVALKTEEDGRMFPVTDSSATIVECLQGAARAAGVAVRLESGVARVAWSQGRFQVSLHSGETLAADRLLIATGGNRSAGGLAVAAAFGHAIEPPVPSLFTFHVEDNRLAGLAGLAVGEVEAAVPSERLVARGPLLVTHWGLSGPAILKLSAWGARVLAARDYRFELNLNLVPGRTAEAVAATLAGARAAQPRKQVTNWSPVGIPLRLWERLAAAAGLSPAATWATLSNEAIRSFALQLTQCSLTVAGKSLNKEEFVTCGGVRLAEVDFRTMESRLQPGLHFAGEVLDIDGLTGGFNFQAAWTTARIAGEAMAAAAIPAADG